MILGTVTQNTVKFSGKLDENTRLAGLVELHVLAAKAGIDGEVVFDFGECRKANSIGISVWINFLQSNAVRARYCNVPEWLVSQFNLLDELSIGICGVDSVLAPYYCDDNSDTTFQVINTQDIEELRQKIANDQFGEIIINGLTFVPDFDAKEYFDFLLRIKKN